MPGPDELFVLMDSSSPAKPLSVIPNNKEDATTSPSKLVPPGVKVADRHVLLSVELTATPSRGNVRRIKTLRLAVSNDETFEEYLRVFKEVQKILTDAGATFSDFAKNFYNALTPAFSVLTAGVSVLTAQGKMLWEAACTAVQTAPATGPAPGRDDRPLYWARLQAIAALRAYCKRNKLTLAEPTIRQFEWPSRGLEWPKGNISFDLAPASSRKAIVTGFDPFFMPPIRSRVTLQGWSRSTSISRRSTQVSLPSTSRRRSSRFVTKTSMNSSPRTRSSLTSTLSSC